jgi:hypothetical protein
MATPELDSITQWCAEQLARREGLSLSKALDRLAADGWRHYTAAEWDRFASVPSVAEEKETRRNKRVLSAWVDLTSVSDIHALARAENRTVSFVVKQLLLDGVARHKLAAIDTKAA